MNLLKRLIKSSASSMNTALNVLSFFVVTSTPYFRSLHQLSADGSLQTASIDTAESSWISWQTTASSQLISSAPSSFSIRMPVTLEVFLLGWITSLCLISTVTEFLHLWSFLLMHATTVIIFRFVPLSSLANVINLNQLQYLVIDRSQSQIPVIWLQNENIVSC